MPTPYELAEQACELDAERDRVLGMLYDALAAAKVPKPGQEAMRLLNLARDSRRNA